MPQLAEQATDPGRMRPDFQCDPTARHRPENFLQCFRIRTDSLLQLYLAGLIHHAVPTVAIAQIQSNGQFPLRNIPALRCCSGANLLHCRSPFYLCFEHVDNLGAYTASRPETGLLIPSDYNNHRGKRRSFQRKVLVMLVLRVRPLSPIGLLAVALLLVTPLAAQDTASAKALLESAFRLYKNGGKGVDTHSNRYYHSSLKALMTADEKAARDKGTDIPFARGADNFCGCQEWEGFWVSKMDLSVQTRDR